MDEMSRDEMNQLVRTVGFGHLCLANGGQAYGIPLFYAFDGTTFFFQSHPGLKDEYASATQEACLVITEVESPDEWRSAQAFGRIEKVVQGTARLHAVDELMHVPFPPDRGVLQSGTPKRSGFDLHVWSLRPTRWSGRKSQALPA